MILTLDRIGDLSELMIAYKLSDLKRYLRVLERCKKFLDTNLYEFYFNLSKTSIFYRKGYFKNYDS